MTYFDKVVIGILVVSLTGLIVIFTGSIWALTASMVIS